MSGLFVCGWPSSGRRWRLVVFAVLYAAALGAASESGAASGVPVVAEVEAYVPRWDPLFAGIDLAQARMTAPEPLAVYAVRIDLANPTIRFLVTPSNGEQELETNGQKTSTFLETHRCQVAINASPFGPVLDTEGTPRDIQGLSVSRGAVYSEAKGNQGAILITRDNHVTLATPPFEVSGVYNAASGFGMLIEDGRSLGTTEGPRHPRTAAGVSQDGRFLYLLVIDGRQPDYSVGATTAETAAWLRQLGAYTGLNLDGGGSTTLVIAGPKGRARVVNRPIHNRIPGTERVNGNHLGVFAEPLGEPSKP